MPLLSLDEFAEHIEAILLRGHVYPSPAPEHLREMIVTAFYASLEKEEGNEVQFALACLDQETLRSPHSGVDVWCPCLFEEPIAFSVETITKLAPAVNPAYSVIAVSAIQKNLYIVGVVRVSRARYRLSRNEVTSGRLTPWQCVVVKALAPGRLRVDVGGDHVASFARGSVRQTDGVNVLGSGLIRDRLWNLANKNGLDCFHYCEVVHRTLLSLWERGHGGIVIIQEAADLHPFEGGFRISAGGTNLQDAVRGLEGYDPATVRIELSDHPVVESEDERRLRLERERERRQLERELEKLHFLEDATDFAADLASRDGALVLRDDLTTLAFGVRIVVEGGQPEILHAITSDAQQVKCGSPIAHLGTRHNSAARFAGHSLDSVVFVVSEDGSTSAMYRPSAESAVHIWRPVALVWSWPFQS